MNILIAGANGGIGNALGNELAARGHVLQSISRSAEQPLWSKLHLVANTSDEASIELISNWLKEKSDKLDLVIQCAGFLSGKTIKPEKSLPNFDEKNFIDLLKINLFSHINLAKAVSSVISVNNVPNWVSISARVGSIEDNRSGGWYSYRMSKTALNMFIRNLKIEWRRISKSSCVVSLHPGTTDTALSKPFQKRIPENKLYNPSLSAERIANIVENLTPKQSGQFLNWDGTTLPF